MRIILHHEFVEQGENEHRAEQCSQSRQWPTPAGLLREGAHPPEQCRGRAENNKPGIEVGVRNAEPLIGGCKTEPLPHMQANSHSVHRQVNIEAQQADQCRSCPGWEGEGLRERHRAVEDDAPADPDSKWYRAEHDEEMPILVDM